MPTTSARPHVAYIISMPHGMDRWTYRELDALTAEGLAVSVYPLRYGAGPYAARPEWKLYRFTRRSVARRLLAQIARQPRRTLALLSEAIRTRTVPDLLLAMDFSARMAREGATRIHCVFGDHKLFIGYYCKRLLGVPLSVALYGYDLRANPNWPMFHRAIAACDAIVVNCELNKRLLAEVAGEAAGARAEVIRHHADPAPPGEQAVRLLMVGGFEPRKGHDVLFAALKRLSAEPRAFEAWVAGYAGRVDVATLAQDMGVADRVRVLGAVSEETVELLFRECDIFCLPSRVDADGISEGLPVALIEAMAHGKPVVATRVGGVPELVEDAFLVPPEDPAALAETLRRLIRDADLRQNAGARNRATIARHYSADNVLRLRDLFLDAPGQPATSTSGEQPVGAPPRASAALSHE